MTRKISLLAFTALSLSMAAPAWAEPQSAAVNRAEVARIKAENQKGFFGRMGDSISNFFYGDKNAAIDAGANANVQTQAPVPGASPATQRQPVTSYMYNRDGEVDTSGAPGRAMGNRNNDPAARDADITVINNDDDDNDPERTDNARTADNRNVLNDNDADNDGITDTNDSDDDTATGGGALAPAEPEPGGGGALAPVEPSPDGGGALATESPSTDTDSDEAAGAGENRTATESPSINRNPSSASDNSESRVRNRSPSINRSTAGDTGSSRDSSGR